MLESIQLMCVWGRSARAFELGSMLESIQLMRVESIHSRLSTQLDVCLPHC